MKRQDKHILYKKILQLDTVWFILSYYENRMMFLSSNSVSNVANEETTFDIDTIFQNDLQRHHHMFGV